LPLCLIKHQALKMYGEEKAVGGGEWKTTRGVLLPQKRSQFPLNRRLPIWGL
jgi:hypothetical protein